jgi:hypothetical protein
MLITRTSRLGALLISALAICPAAHAQGRWGAELRPSINFPLQDLNGTELASGPGAEFNVSYRLLERLSVYAGWGWFEFSPKEGLDKQFEETGYVFGLRFLHPINDVFHYTLSAGSVYGHLEMAEPDGEIIADTGHGFGWQAEAGIGISLSDHVMFVPSVRYHTVSRELTLSDTTTTLDLRYLSVGIGVSFRF